MDGKDKKQVGPLNSANAVDEFTGRRCRPVVWVFVVVAQTGFNDASEASNRFEAGFSQEFGGVGAETGGARSSLFFAARVIH